MFSSDEIKWANSKDEDLDTIAKKWAKEYSTKRLRQFQDSYKSLMNGLNRLTESELKGEITDNTIAHDALNNRFDAAQRAVNIREFHKKRVKK